MSDLRALRSDFPILQREVNGKPLVYLDSAATTQKPMSVLAAMDEDYELQIVLHHGYHDSKDRYPVLYLTDSSGFLGYVRALVASQGHEKTSPQMIIVGTVKSPSSSSTQRSRVARETRNTNRA